MKLKPKFETGKAETKIVKKFYAEPKFMLPPNATELPPPF